MANDADGVFVLRRYEKDRSDHPRSERGFVQKLVQQESEREKERERERERNRK